MAKDPNIRSAYEKTKRVPYVSKLPSRTKQAPHAECDINVIMSKYQQTGVIEHVNNRPGEYGSFIGYADYHTSLNQILEAQQSFDQLPSSIRARFINDPAEFLKFAQDPANLHEMTEMGLTRTPVAEPTQADTPVSEAEASPTSNDEPNPS